MRKLNLISSICVVVITGSINYLNAQCQGNVITNGSFTDTKGEYKLAFGWEREGATPDVNDENGPVFTTDKYEWIGQPLPSNDGGTWQNIWATESFRQIISLTPCQTYTMCFEYALQPIIWETTAGGQPVSIKGDVPSGIVIKFDGEIVFTSPEDDTPYTWESTCYTFVATSSQVYMTIATSMTNATVKTGTYMGIDGMCIQPTSPTTLTTNASFCSGQSASLTPKTAATGATYLWNNNSRQESLQVNSPGTYSVDITHPSGCKTAETFIVESTNPPAVNLQYTPVCVGENLTLDAGVSGAEYLWSTGAKTKTITTTQAGEYWVWVDTDGSRSCLGGDTIQVNFENAPQINLDDQTICPDGSATVEAGVVANNYLWFANGETTSSITVSAPGTYVLEVNKGGCSSADTAIVTQAPGLTPIIDAVTQPSCNGAFGEARARQMDGGGNGAYTFDWSNGQTTKIATGLTSGTHTVTIVNKFGCSGSASVLIEGTGGFTSTTKIKYEDGCDRFGGSLANATVNPTGGIAPYSYQWNDATNQTSQTAMGLSPGIYNVNITDSKGCTSEDTVKISNKIQVDINIDADPCATCSDGQLTGQVTGFGTSPFTYRWNDANEQTTTTASGLTPGSYVLLVTDANGCFSSDTVSIGILGLDDFVKSKQVRIYPNPNEGSFVINFQTKQPEHITIFDAQGRMVKYEKLNNLNEHQVNLNVQPGIYYVQCDFENHQVTKKIMISSK